MTQEILKLALEYIEAVPDDRYNAEHIDRDALITAIEEALAQPEQEPVAVYGYCPECGEKGVMRERRPNGNDKCVKGHTYPSNTATSTQRQRVVFPTMGLTAEEIGDEYVRFEVSKGGFNRFEYAVRAIEAKLKEKNT